MTLSGIRRGGLTLGAITGTRCAVEEASTGRAEVLRLRGSTIGQSCAQPRSCCLTYATQARETPLVYVHANREGRRVERRGSSRSPIGLPGSCPHLSGSWAAELGRSTRWIELRMREGMPGASSSDALRARAVDRDAVHAWPGARSGTSPVPLDERVARLEREWLGSGTPWRQDGVRDGS